MSFAVVNGMYFDARLKSCDIRNVMVNGSKITGVGYIPDEDEDTLTIVDADKNSLVAGVSDFIYMPHTDHIASTCDTIYQHGVQHIAFLPNAQSNPLDTPDSIESILNYLSDHQLTDCLLVGSASLGNLPNELAELSLLAKSGVSAIYFDRIIENPELLKQALIFMDMVGLPIIFGPMTTLFVTKAHLNAGKPSFEIGIRGESLLVEDTQIQYVLDMIHQHCKVPVHFSMRNIGYRASYDCRI